MPAQNVRADSGTIVPNGHSGRFQLATAKFGALVDTFALIAALSRLFVRTRNLETPSAKRDAILDPRD